MVNLGCLIDTLYSMLPEGTAIGGQYLIHYLNGELEKVNRLDLIISQKPDRSLLRKIRTCLNQQLIEIDLVEEFSGYKPPRIEAKLINTNGQSEFRLTISNDLNHQVFFSANGLLIGRNGKLGKRGRGNNSVRECLTDIHRKRLKISDGGAMERLGEGIDRKYNYLRLVDFVGSIVTDDSSWTMDGRLSPYFQIRKSTDEEEICSICRDEINSKQPIKLRDCNHWYHLECLQKHISGVGPRHSRCPICRSEII